MKTKRVRIMVVIDPSGNYNAGGWNDANEESLRRSVLMNGMPTEHQDFEMSCRWIEADVPIPETGVIEGEVKEAGARQ